MSLPGRPRALDEFKRREVCALVAVGCGIDGAAHYVGCNATTIRREALRNSDFHEQLRNAELANQLDPLRAMRKAAGTHWRAAAWLLERTRPDRFGRRNPATLTIEDLDGALTTLAEEIIGELPDNETVLRVCQRVDAAKRRLTREARAASRVRRDPHRARRRAAQSRIVPYPPPTLLSGQNDLNPAEGACEAPAESLTPDTRHPTPNN